MIDFVVVSSDLQSYELDTRVKRGAELSPDHHLVVSWIRWWGRKLERPDRPNWIVRVGWKRLAEDPLKKGGSWSPGGSREHGIWVGHVPCSIVEKAAQSCGSKVAGASHGSNPRTHCWSPEVKGPIKLKEETYKALLACGTQKATERPSDLWLGWSLRQGKSWVDYRTRPGPCWEEPGEVVRASGLGCLLDVSGVSGMSIWVETPRTR